MWPRAPRWCFWNLFHQGNSLLSPIEANRDIYQRYIGLHPCCWITASRCRHPPLQSCGWWDPLFLLLLITGCAKPCVPSTLKLAHLLMSWLSVLALSKLSSCPRTPCPPDPSENIDDWCNCLEVAKPLPWAGRWNHAWWGFPFFFCLYSHSVHRV